MAYTMASLNTPGSPADPYSRPHGGGKADSRLTATTTTTTTTTPGTTHAAIDTDRSRQTSTLYDAVAGTCPLERTLPFW